MTASTRSRWVSLASVQAFGVTLVSETREPGGIDGVGRNERPVQRGGYSLSLIVARRLGDSHATSRAQRAALINARTRWNCFQRGGVFLRSWVDWLRNESRSQTSRHRVGEPRSAGHLCWRLYVVACAGCAKMRAQKASLTTAPSVASQTFCSKRCTNCRSCELLSIQPNESPAAWVAGRGPSCACSSACDK